MKKKNNIWHDWRGSNENPPPPANAKKPVLVGLKQNEIPVKTFNIEVKILEKEELNEEE